MPGKKQFGSAISKSGGAVTRRLVKGDEGATRAWIDLSADTDERLVLHEAAHTWHSTTAPDGQAFTTQGEAAIRQLATTERWLGGLDKHVDDEDLIAESCAVAWLAASDTRQTLERGD
jgi:hypothetical protein